ncbi:site-specific integrase [Janibacter melonis]|uniref:tyrosine-type recombinase/integrase n=1 Tax=Janibacter melonis TaxID=262209 RepID=UPI0020434D3F|nr:site-specific integrase [Janibacter melonis]MCM3556447.1 site-specific integrase [Janibacter melonis]
MASIQKRENGSWRARYRDEGGREHARHFPRKVDAQRWLDEVTASIVTSTYVDPRAGSLTFAQWWQVWSARQVWTRGTRLSADQAAASVTFADVPMRSIRPSHVEQWIKVASQPADGSAGIAASTMKVRFSYVQMALLAAVRERIIAHDPSAEVRKKLPKTRKPEAAMLVPTAEQVAAALEVSPAHFRPFVAVCAFSGLRLGEAAGLQLGDVDFLRRSIAVARQVQGASVADVEIVSPKAESERTIYVPEELTDLLAAHVQEIGTRGPERWLFCNGPEVWNRNSAGNQWRRIREAAGLGSDLTLHSLRHFYASGLIAAGCDVVTVQRSLGHSSATVTLNTYAHLWSTAEDRTRAAAGQLMADVLRPAADSLRTVAP